MVDAGEQLLKTTCRLCRRECGMLVSVEEGKIARVKGNPDYPINQGKLCEKAGVFKKIVYHPHRLLHPLRRVGDRGENRWQQISWDDALDIVADRLSRLKETEGPQALGHQVGDELDEGVTFHRRFFNVYGSPNYSSTWGLCYASKAMAFSATFGTVVSSDREGTKCIVLWGINPAVSFYDSGDYRGWGMGPILQAQKRGAKLIVIDPRRSETAAKADYWIPLRPGTDMALALGMIHIIVKERLYDEAFVEQWTEGFPELEEHVAKYPPAVVGEITGIPTSTIEEVARIFATNRPATIETFEGTDHKITAVQTSRAFAILGAITGNLDVPGGETLFQPAFRLKLSGLPLAECLPKDPPAIGAVEHPLFHQFHGEAVPSLFPRAILEGKPYPLRALIVEAGNPALVWANTTRVLEALRNLDFLVSLDIFLNETAELADIVLPGATFLERDNLTMRYSPRFLAARQEVCPPLEESWPSWKFWFKLAQKMGFESQFSWQHIQEVLDMVLEPTGINFGSLKEKDFVMTSSPVQLKKYEQKGFNTPSKKVELYSQRYEEMGYEPLPTYKESPFFEDYAAGKYPLALTTHRISFHYNSWLHAAGTENYLEMHTEDARWRQINDGDWVQVENAMGSVRIRVKLTDGIARGVVSMPAGFGNWARWRVEALKKGESTGANINFLTSEEARDPISSAPAYRHTFCEVRKIAP